MVREDLDEQSVCLERQQKGVSCTWCQKSRPGIAKKPLSAFDVALLRKCRQQRTLTTRAVCRECQQLGAKKRTEETLVECQDCGALCAQNEFTKEKRARLRRLEISRVRRAVCEQATDHVQLAQRQCRACETHLPLHAFAKDSRTCHACMQGSCAQRGKRGQYRAGTLCLACAYPPCLSCDKPRPRNGKYHVKQMPVWQCHTCKISASTS